jgi:hypothetical protein
MAKHVRHRTHTLRAWTACFRLRDLLYFPAKRKVLLRMQSHELQPSLRRRLFQLRVIVVVFAAGIAAYGAVAIAQNWGLRHTVWGNVDVLMEGAAVGSALAGIFMAPSLVRFDAKRPSIATGNDDEHEHYRIFRQLQRRTIIGCGLFQLAAIANLYTYATSQEVIHVVVALILMLLILSRFPLRGIMAARIADSIVRQREKLSLQLPE